MMTDIDALRRYADRGDPKAFEHLVRQYQAMVLAICRRRLSNPDDVDDAVQETFVKLAKNARRIRSNVAAWLHRCALNTALDLVRKNTIRRKHEAVPSVVVQGEQDSEWAEIRQHMDEAINALNKDQKRLIVEHFFLGRTQSDLAEVLGVSQSSIHRRIQRAVQHLRQQLHRRGVVVTAAALSGFCVTATANAAVGPVLSANLAKISLAGVGLTPAPAITTGVLTMATLTGKPRSWRSPSCWVSCSSGRALRGWGITGRIEAVHPHRPKWIHGGSDCGQRPYRIPARDDDFLYHRYGGLCGLSMVVPAATAF